MGEGGGDNSVRAQRVSASSGVWLVEEVREIPSYWALGSNLEGSFSSDEFLDRGDGVLPWHTPRIQVRWRHRERLH